MASPVTVRIDGCRAVMRAHGGCAAFFGKMLMVAVTPLIVGLTGGFANLSDMSGGAIVGSLARKSRDERNLSLTTYDAVLHVHYYYNPGWNESAWRQTREALEQALEKEPDSVTVQVALAEILTDGFACGVREATEADIERAEDILRRQRSIRVNP